MGGPAQLYGATDRLALAAEAKDNLAPMSAEDSRVDDRSGKARRGVGITRTGHGPARLLSANGTGIRSSIMLLESRTTRP